MMASGTLSEKSLGAHSLDRETIEIQCRGHIPALDGIRGMAIGAVLFHHLWPWVWDNPFYSAITRLSHISWMGIDFFFVLSGFLISGILLDTRSKPRYFRNFMMRRLLRIFPAYYLFLFLVLFLLPGLLPAGFMDGEHPDAAWYFLYGSNYLWVAEDPTISQLVGSAPSEFKAPDYLGVTWSLSVEEQFYLIWPVVVLLFYRRLPAVIVSSVLVVILVRILLVTNIEEWADATYMASICRADSLIVGAALAYYARSGAFRSNVWRYIVNVGLYICLPSALGYQLLFPGRADNLFSMFGYTMLSVGCVGFVALAVQKKPTWASKVATVKPLCWLGKYSYGIYLYHMVFWHLSHKLINAEVSADGKALEPELFSPIGGSLLIDAPVRMILCTVVSLVAAWLSYHFFEKHFLKFKRFF